jgi:hypothetical protein
MQTCTHNWLLSVLYCLRSIIGQYASTHTSISLRSPDTSPLLPTAAGPAVETTGRRTPASHNTIIACVGRAVFCGGRGTLSWSKPNRREGLATTSDPRPAGHRAYVQADGDRTASAVAVPRTATMISLLRAHELSHARCVQTIVGDPCSVHALRGASATAMPRASAPRVERRRPTQGSEATGYIAHGHDRHSEKNRNGSSKQSMRIPYRCFCQWHTVFRTAGVIFANSYRTANGLHAVFRSYS